MSTDSTIDKLKANTEAANLANQSEGQTAEELKEKRAAAKEQARREKTLKSAKAQIIRAGTSVASEIVKTIATDVKPEEVVEMAREQILAALNASVQEVHANLIEKNPFLTVEMLQEFVPAGLQTALITVNSAAQAKYVPPPVEEVPRKYRNFSPRTSAPVDGEENILITSALPYVNNVPHLGNIIGCVLSADVYARYCRLRGKNCLYICGTDEYGTATETKAVEENMSPRGICDKYFQEHKGIYEWFDIQFDYFGRTSTPNPQEDKDWPQTQICQEIFKSLENAGFITEGVVEQMYCLACQKFLADRFIEGQCPLCGYEDARGDQCDKCGKLLSPTELINPVCKVGRGNSEHKVEVRSSNHLFLDLPKISTELDAWVDKTSKEGNWTDNAIQITKSWLRDGLKPRCITRDLKWGTPVPKEGFQDKVFYVWFDAPIGYLSITACFTEQWRQWWQNPKNVKLYQFMGKDNIPFHCVIFPSSLIGSRQDWTMLHHVSTTEYLNYESGKFSKSRKVGVFGDNARETGIPSEVWRYYLLAIRPEASDSTFTWADFAEKTNNELLKNLGNLVNRSLAFTFATFGGKTPDTQDAPATAEDNAFVESVNKILQEYRETMDQVHIRQGLRLAMELSSEVNTYMQANAAWELKGKDDVRCAQVMTMILSAVRLLAAVMEPFMPGFTDKVCYLLDLPHIDIPDTFDRTLCPPAHPFKKPAPIFSAISQKQVTDLQARFRGIQEESTPVSETTPAVRAEKKPAKAPVKKKEAKPSKPTEADLCHLPDIARVDLRVGKIVKAWPHPEADGLWCEEIDLGEEKPRTIASGLRAYYKDAEELEGRLVCVVANLKPRNMRGFRSEGMVLCASAEDNSKVEFVDPPAGAVPGERLVPLGQIPDGAPFPVPEIINVAKEGNPWTAVANNFGTNEEKIACWNGFPLMTQAGPCSAPTLASVHVG